MATNETEISAIPAVEIAPVTLLPGTVEAAPPGVRGFDANMVVSEERARAFARAGYRFCIRYVGREVMADHDLTAKEARTILNAGMALMVVQHVKREGWHPTGPLGAEYGENAGRFTHAIGVPREVCLWCDLEGVAKGVPAQDVIAYCNSWYDEVLEAGYTPGLYVGFAPGLNRDQLYRRLRFQHYWRAYNLNADQVPAVRGVQLRQKVGSSGTVAGVSTQAYDDDVTMTDSLGGNAVWLAPGA
jgi:hypothetical protein